MRRCWRRRGWPVALLASAVLLIAGCGSTVTKKDVVARADGICADTLREVRAVPAPVSQSVAALSAYYARVAPIVESEATAVEKLPRPRQDQRVLNRWISSVDLFAAEYRAIANAARLGDRQAIATAQAAVRTNDAPALAAGYGLRVCTGAAGTSVGS
jgi:hypothetical protein